MNRFGLIEKEFTGSIIEAFFDVYNELGFGYLEQGYMASLASNTLPASYPPFPRNPR